MSNILIGYKKRIQDLEHQIEVLEGWVKEKEAELAKATKRITSLEKQIDNKGSRK